MSDVRLIGEKGKGKEMKESKEQGEHVYVQGGVCVCVYGISHRG